MSPTDIASRADFEHAQPAPQTESPSPVDGPSDFADYERHRREAQGWRMPLLYREPLDGT